MSESFFCDGFSVVHVIITTIIKSMVNIGASLHFLDVLYCVVSGSGISCPNPGTLVNGQIGGTTEYFDGATVTFTCNANFELNGVSSMTCSSSGTWSSSLPTCIGEKKWFFDKFKCGVHCSNFGLVWLKW